MNIQKSITIAFLGNANHDTRVTNLSSSLRQDGSDVKVISFDWATPSFQTILGKTSIHKLDKSKSSIHYYFNFSRILFNELNKTNSQIYIAEDIYTLPLVCFFAKIRRAKLYYNSREFYAFLGGLRNRKFLQTIIRAIEKIFIKMTDNVLVTGEGDADFLQEYYGITNTVVIRNLPLYKKSENRIDLRIKLNIPQDDKILLYQGVILEGRGFTPILEAMSKVSGYHLTVLGSGPFQLHYQKIAKDLHVNDRVHFLGSIDQSELIDYTASADIGLALIENISKSYYYALPNKLFEYIMAEVPVFCSDLPQMKKIVEDYNVGRVVNMNNENHLIEVLEEFSTADEDFQKYSKNCKSASAELNWEKEYEKVKYLFIV